MLLYEADEEEWQVDLAGYEGPIDLLLSLARDRKIDLTVLSISDLADQYLKFISQAKALAGIGADEHVRPWPSPS